MQTGPKWYILRAGHRIGPLDASQLKYMATHEQLELTDWVWKEGMAQWVQAQQVQGLFHHVSAAASAAAAAPVAAPTTPVPATSPATSAATPVIAALTPTASSPPAGAERPVQPAQPTQPTYAQRKPLPAISTARDAWAPIAGAILILITIVIPWQAKQQWSYGPTSIVWSWSAIGDSFSGNGKGVYAIWMIIAWIAGLATLIFTPLTKGALRGGIYTALGFVATILLMVAWFNARPEVPRFGESAPETAVRHLHGFASGASEAETAFFIITTLGVLTAAVALQLARRSGSNGALRGLQVVAGGAIVIGALVLFIVMFAASNSVWSQYGYKLRSPNGTLMKVSMVFVHIGFILGGALTLLAGITGQARGALNTGALFVLYLGIALAPQATSFFIAAGTEQWPLALTSNCVLLIVFGTAVVLCSGLILLVDHARRVGTPLTLPPTGRAMAHAAPAGEAIEQKFAKLDALRKSGMISDAEYQQKREQLLKQI